MRTLNKKRVILNSNDEDVEREKERGREREKSGNKLNMYSNLKKDRAKEVILTPITCDQR
jgi:hypothetical protein